MRFLHLKHDILDLLETILFDKFISRIIKNFAKKKLHRSIKRKLSFQKIDIQGVHFHT